MKSSAKNIQMTKFDDLFSAGNPAGAGGSGNVQEIPLTELFPFKDHPFKVLDDETMQDTVESIRIHGVLVPGIARPRAEGGYGKPIPKVAQLSEEYAALLAEKKECYEEYKAARKEMVDYQTAKYNVDIILGLEPQEAEKKKETER